MLNQTGVRVTHATTRKTILVDEKNSTAVSCIVSNTGVSAGEEGRKIIKAGTPVTGDLMQRETEFTVATSAENIAGIILHDVDVTAGNANSQCVIFGTIDVSKLESDVEAMLTKEIREACKMVNFIK